MITTDAFNTAVSQAMLFEVGRWFNANDPETKAGLIGTQAQRKKVGYVNDPDDAGGETKFGIAKSGNPDVDIKNLTWDQAREIYKRRYWDLGGCQLLPIRVAILHFDGCVNHGLSKEAKFLQEVAGVVQDGQVGKGTAAAVTAMNEFDVCRLLCDRREKFYRDIVQAKPTQAKFLNGWLARIAYMRDAARNPF